ncbi:MAG: alanine--tRNA ligase-related protein [Ktedonobacterales bacterium]
MPQVMSPWPYPYSSEQIAETFLSFYAQHGHLRIPGAPLAMPGTTTSFVVAGMQPLVPYFTGRESPPAPRLTDVQRCLRTDDVELVGSNSRKISTFQMLGNWSIGDYGRREAIEMSVELLGRLGIDWKSLWVTTFGGDDALNLPPDEETAREWRRIGIPETRLIALGAEDNFWSTGGPGPCGRDSELFVDRGPAAGCGKPTCRPGCECDRFLEIWNLVFIEFEQHQDGSISGLPFSSVDTGMGLERVAMVLQHAPSVFEVDILAPALDQLDQLIPEPAPTSGRAVELSRQQSRRMIVDHMRSTLFLGVEGIVPERDGRGSVLRRLIRRAATRGQLLGISQPFLSRLLAPLAKAHGGLLTGAEHELTADIAEMVNLEERRFAQILRTGLRLLDRAVLDELGRASGEWLFRLQAEQGFPADLAAEVLAQRGILVEWPSFYAADLRHREVSRVKRGK